MKNIKFYDHNSNFESNNKKPKPNLIDQMINIMSNDINLDSDDMYDIEPNPIFYDSTSSSPLADNITRKFPTLTPSTTLSHPSSSISCGHFHNCAITLPYSSLVCWGANEFNESIVPFSTYNYAVNAVAAGLGHTCSAIEGELQCWG